MQPDLVENLRSLVASQYAEADRAIYGRMWKLYSSSQSPCRNCLAVADWKALSELQRQRIRLAVFCLMNEGVADTKQSTATDGNLTVLHCPDAGKKLGLGNRRQPRADCTVTQNKKKENCDCVKRHAKLTAT